MTQSTHQVLAKLKEEIIKRKAFRATDDRISDDPYIESIYNIAFDEVLQLISQAEKEGEV